MKHLHIPQRSHCSESNARLTHLQIWKAAKGSDACFVTPIHDFLTSTSGWENTNETCPSIAFQLSHSIMINSVRRRSIKRSRKVSILILYMNVTFLICWLPYGVLAVLRFIYGERWARGKGPYSGWGHSKKFLCFWANHGALLDFPGWLMNALVPSLATMHCKYEYRSKSQQEFSSFENVP